MSAIASEFQSGGVSVVQDCSRNGVYEEYFRNGSIFATSVQGTKELKVVVPSGSSLTITTASRELSSGTCKLKYKRNEGASCLLLCNLHGDHPVTGLGLTCVGPDTFYLEAKGTKINVFGSVSAVEEAVVQEQAVQKVAVVAMTDSDIPPISNSSCVVVEQDRCSSGLFQESFAPGIVFATAVQGTKDMKVKVPAGTSLTLSTASRELSSGTCKLHYKGSDPDAEWHLLCKLHDEHSVTSLGLTTVGPSEFFLKAPGTKINVFGSVSVATPVAHVSSPPVLPAEKESSANTKKRSHEENKDDVAMEDSEGADEPPQLSKKQRRKLAKKKTKELAEAVATLNMHSSIVEGTNGVQQSDKQPVSFTKERRLPSGVTVKDLMLGTGGAVKAGRKVSIIYEGSFPDGKVFDRNKNKNNPLTFRLGTGAVVRGLEHGLEGMKVGGEREITIPPDLGYGKKGSGNVVPPNSTLVFSVQVISAG